MRARLSKSIKGKIVSEKARENISIAAKLRSMSDVYRAKLSEAAKKRPPVSEDTKRKISETTRGRTKEETRRKMSDAKKGKPKSADARRQMSQSAKNRGPMPEDVRRKISEALKSTPERKRMQQLSKSDT